MDDRIKKHFEEELAKLNVELKSFDDAVAKAKEAEALVDDCEVALDKANADRDSVKVALGIAEEKVELASGNLVKALADFEACKSAVCDLADEAKLAKRDEFIDILAEIARGEEAPDEVCEEVVEASTPEAEEPAVEEKVEEVVEEAPIVEETAVVEPQVEVAVEEKPAEDHKAIFESLIRKHSIR